jgi:hypothetical protein
MVSCCSYHCDDGAQGSSACMEIAVLVYFFVCVKVAILLLLLLLAIVASWMVASMTRNASDDGTTRSEVALTLDDCICKDNRIPHLQEQARQQLEPTALSAITTADAAVVFVGMCSISGLKVELAVRFI